MENMLNQIRRISLINKINDILIRFTGEGLSEEDVQKRLVCDLELLEGEYRNKKFIYCMHDLNWN